MNPYLVSLRRLLLLLGLLFGGLVPMGATAALDFGPRPRAPNDETQYRRFELENGLRVLLVHDPKFNKSGAALAVRVGALDDPPERPGMAHFLEHMLFLGTEKFPDVNEYSGFVNGNGGYNNAYTASDHTNYMFEVRHEAFEGAIDRFAQFFIAPLFTPEFTEREINAINNEAERYRENDNRRLWQVRRELYAPDSPESKFSTGNRETLAGVTREELLEFYQRYYTSDRMALVLAGKASLDELERLARTYFSGILRREVAPLERESRFLPPREALRLALVEPIKEVRQLHIEWPIGPTRPDFAAKPAELIASLLGYEGQGSLLAQLKEEGLATALGAFAYERTAEYGSMHVGMDLTPAGEENYLRALELTFAYLDLLRRSPFPQTFFEERATLARLDEAYRDKGEGAPLATSLAALLLEYPLEIAERAPFIWAHPDEAAYRRVLDELRPDRSLAILVAKGVPTDRAERYFDIRYSVREKTGEPFARLQAARAADVASFSLPRPNPFIPQRTDVLVERPTRLIDEPGLALFYWQDLEFQRPMTSLLFRVRVPRDHVTLENTVLGTFYAACVNEAMNEVAYDAQLAGISYSVGVTLEGARVSVDGYSDSVPRFFEYLTGQLLDFTLDEARFEALKDRIVRGLASFPRSETFQLAQDRKWGIAREFHFSPLEQLPVAHEVTLAQVRAYARELFGRGRIEALAHGNLTDAEAVAAARRLQAQLGTRPVPAEALLQPRFTVLAPGEVVVDAGRVEGNNSCFWSEYVLPDDTPETRAAALVLGNFLNEPFYTEMRTIQQLGYLVWGGVSTADLQLFGYFVIQSGDYAPDELRRRAETFIATLPTQWGQIGDEQWEAFVGGARSQLEERPKTIAQKAGQMFDRAYRFGEDWNRRTDTLAALDRLTRERVGEILTALLAPETQRQRTILLTGREHQNTEEPATTFRDREQWKAGRSFR
jgi:insulysin